MKKLKKIIWTFVLTIITLYLLALVAFKLVINPKVLSNAINKAFQEKIGKPVTMTADIHLSVFPLPGIEMHQVSLDFADQNEAVSSIFKANNANLYISLSDLIRGKIVIRKLSLQSPIINLTPTLMQHTDASKALADHKSQTRDHKTTVAIDELVINNASVNWIPTKNTPSLQIQHLNLSIKNNDNQALNFRCDWQMNNASPRLSVNGSSEGQVNYQLLTEQYQLPHFLLNTTVQYENNPAQTINLLLKANLDKNKQLLDIQDLSGKIGAYSINAIAKGQNVFSDAALYTGHMAVKGGLLNNQNANFDFLANASSAKLSHILASIQEMTISGDLILSQLNTLLTVDSNLDIQNFNRTLVAKKANVNLVANHLHWQTHLTTMQGDKTALLAHLSGVGAITATGIQLKGLDVPGYIQTVFKQFAVHYNASKTSTVNLFETGQANYQINNGVINKSTLNLTGKQTVVDGHGAINLIQETLNYELALRDHRLDDVTVILNLTGDLTDPKITPNIKTLRQLLYNTKIKNSLNKVLNSLKGLVK